MAAPRIRKLVTASKGAGTLGAVFLQEDDGHLLPWDAITEKLAELLRFLASALPAVAAGIRDCCVYCAAGGRRRRMGPDGEEADGGDGPVVRYGGRGRGGYRGGIFSMHPNKPIVC